MAEYIEREAALGVLCEYCPCDPDCNKDMCYEHNRIKEMPAADVVEVVRCKDCKHWGGVTFGYICRRFSGTTLRNETRENDYCSFGEKMDGKGEG